MSSEGVFKRFAIHTFLQWFCHTLIVTFGVLFIYEKTSLIGLALGIQLIWVLTNVLARSVFVSLWWNTLLKRKATKSMLIGMILIAVGAFGMYFSDTSSTLGLALTAAFAATISFGATMYWLPANALFYRIIGESNAPGRRSSTLSIVRLSSGIIAALSSLALNTYGGFLLLLPILGIVSLLSLIPLRGIEFPSEEPVSWRRAMKRISPLGFWSNFHGDGELTSSAIPLILVILYGSISSSVFIGATTLLVAIALGYFAGHFKDKGNVAYFLIAFIGVVFVWIAYAFVELPIAFVILGGLQYLFVTILTIGRDARVGRESINLGHATETALAVEFSHAAGGLFGLVVIIGAYLILQTLPQYILLLGVLFILPRGLYALGTIEKIVHSPKK